MEKIYAFYKENIENCARLSHRLKQKMHLIGTIRLIIVIAIVFTFWLFRNENWSIWGSILLVYGLPFIALLVYYNKLSHQKHFAENLSLLNENELKGLDYDFSAFDGAPDKSSADHSFSLDLDLFGDHSIFQSINRTVTPLGRELLADWHLNPLSDKKEIIKRQEAIRELASSHTVLRQEFYVKGLSQQTNKDDSHILSKLAAGETVLSKSMIWKIIIWLIPIVWVFLGIGVYLDIIYSGFLGFFFAISFTITYLPFKKIMRLHNSLDKMQKIFMGYAELMRSVEGDGFKAEALREISQALEMPNGQTASAAIRQLAHYIGNLDHRFSLGGIILNILYFRDMRNAMYLERWKETHADHIHQWFGAIARFDALSSLGGFAFNHPDYVYPEIADTYFQMEGKALGHPLIRREVCVKNDIDMTHTPWFMIITGANMAGKSTYLRTVGVNFLLACIGCPVYAEALTVYPARLVTSLRTSDSLTGNESYFFAELKRLQMIIDRLKNGEKLFIILDEILKGTNSVDKQKGSLALMRQLISLQACGIIATHDLVLGSLEEDFPQEVKNYRFEADITNEELSFTYTLRQGIAQNMNAYFLMKKMGITV